MASAASRTSESDPLPSSVSTNAAVSSRCGMTVFIVVARRNRTGHRLVTRLVGYVLIGVWHRGSRLDAEVFSRSQHDHGELIGGVMSKVCVIYYSATGHGTAMARRVADAAEVAGAEVRVRHIAETHDPESFAQNPAWTANYEAHKDLPPATGDDIVWADAVIFGSPTRFGSVASQLRDFLDSLGGLWSEGTLA